MVLGIHFVKKKKKLLFLHGFHFLYILFSIHPCYITCFSRPSYYVFFLKEILYSMFISTRFILCNKLTEIPNVMFFFKYT